MKRFAGLCQFVQVMQHVGLGPVAPWRDPTWVQSFGDLPARGNRSLSVEYLVA